MSTGRLVGKVVIVVGAGQERGQTKGNGRATAERFAEEGASLLLVDKNAEAVEETLQAILRLGANASALVADATREDDCRRMAAECIKRFGRIDILQNNVGVAAEDRPTISMDADIWDKLMTINVKSMFMTCKHVLPIMIAQQSGCIINISSIAALATMPHVAYKTAKGAVNTLTQHLAMEHAKNGIRVNCVMPGLIDTPLAIERRVRENKQTHAEVRHERDIKVPLGYQGTAQDIANASIFLASEEASYITGVLLPVDGGLLCKIG